MTVLLLVVVLWLMILDVPDVTYDGKIHSPDGRLAALFNFVRLFSKSYLKK
jgi:hypothetical protein